MKATELTPLQRIEILEDVLKNLESGDKVGGLCIKITASAFEIFDIWEIQSKNIIPIFTLENAKRVTEVKEMVHKEFYWWNHLDNYDFENRIKFVKWMIKMEKSLLNK